jgi:thiamine-monophosphate kinase
MAALPTEDQLLSHIYAHSGNLPSEFTYVEVGPGSDCAIVHTGERSLLKVDSVIEGVHFISTTPVDLIAYKAIARPLSDIAAMAGTPRAALAACVLPRGYEHAQQLFDRVRFWASHYSCPLVGGDIASHPRGTDERTVISAPLILTISILGTAHPTVRALRSGAKVGDDVYVSGALGGSLGHDKLGRHLRPAPRLNLARWLADTLNVTLHAMMDLSDGLGRDAGRIALASNVSIELHEQRIPVHRDVPASLDARASPSDRTLHALSDGEDYELLFTVAHGTPVPAEYDSVPLTYIGNVISQDARACTLVTLSGERIDVSALGFEHST